MKKKILMIGNTNHLPGVSIDIRDYYCFFTSPIGGNWRREEIDIMMDTCRRCLREKIDEIEKADYDYVVTIFSGHGKESISGTVLRINGHGETIEIDDLMNLSQKQLLIFDCCRTYVDMPFDTESEGTILSMSRDPVRKAYEKKIQDFLPQKTLLFACDEGEQSEDTDYGGLYAQSLLLATQIELANSDTPFVSVSRAHYKAVSLMRQNDPFLRQNPQIQQPRCSMQNRLPFAVNPNMLRRYDY